MCAVAQSWLTLGDPMDCSLPGSSAHGIFQARVLELFAIFSSRVSSQLRDWTRIFWVSCIGKQILYHCTSQQAHGYRTFTHVFFPLVVKFSDTGKNNFLILKSVASQQIFHNHFLSWGKYDVLKNIYHLPPYIF